MAAVGALWGACLVIGACDLGPSELASFLDSPYGEVTAETGSLDSDALGAVMDELMLRFRSYLTLREAIPFAALSGQACVSDARGGGEDFGFSVDINCAFGDEIAPADGTIRVAQRLLADQPPVTALDLDYRDVTVGELTVSGREHIEETDATNGASLRSLQLVQDGYTLDYDFRLGLLAGDVPVFDYQLDTPRGGLLARITNPTTPGGLVSVSLVGIDGTLRCEVRDAAWVPGERARGLCDNGLVFGLPSATDAMTGADH